MKIDKDLPKNERILLAAEEVFAKYGFEKATLDEIITLADVGKGTVYKYFGNKEKLFYKLVYDKNLPFVARLQQVVAEEKDLASKLIAYFKEMISFYYENYALWQVIYFEMIGARYGCRVKYIDNGIEVVPRYPAMQISEEIKESVIRYHRIMADEINVLKDILLEGLEQGLLKEGNVDEIRKSLFFGVVMHIFYSVDIVKTNLAPEQFAAIIVDRFLYGESKK